MSFEVVVTVVVVLFLGGVLQSIVGFGIGVVAGPVLAFVAPELMPEALLVAAVVLPLMTIRQEGAAADFRGLRWCLAGRVPGMLLGAYVVARASQRELDLVVGASVLAAVIISLVASRRGLSIRRTPRSLTIAGTISGFTGTSAAVGGPPLALVYQDAAGPQIRATLAVYFAVGGSMSLATIFLLGGGNAHAVAVGLLASPVVAASLAVGGRLQGWGDQAMFRPAVLLASAAAAGVLLVRAVCA